MKLSPKTYHEALTTMHGFINARFKQYKRVTPDRVLLPDEDSLLLLAQIMVPAMEPAIGMLYDNGISREQISMVLEQLAAAVWAERQDRAESKEREGL